ncbi:MAG: hypothetical protein QNJ00_08220, partial [Woeseiaceae bacterium]|nr:hypothetical protein [Woeseiaceae bacterium]
RSCFAPEHAPTCRGQQRSRVHLVKAEQRAVSAVVPVPNRKTARVELGGGYSALLGFHKVYSRALLAAARRRMLRGKA